MSTVATKPVAALDWKNPVARLWRHYLDETKDLIGPRYREVEPWSWNNLQEKLARLQQQEEDDGA